MHCITEGKVTLVNNNNDLIWQTLHSNRITGLRKRRDLLNIKRSEDFILGKEIFEKA